MLSTNRSIVMVDWARHNEPTPRTRAEFLWHQMLLSLLYDDVSAQDEILVCSKKMARWFRDNASFRLLEEVVECGGLGVLKRPHERYPPELQERALEQPITARREHLERFSVNNDGSPLSFDAQQRAFHSRLETLLLSHPHAHRHAGSKSRLGKDLMQEFADLLAAALTDRRYSKWLKTRFKNITPNIAREFVGFIADPNSAIERLKRTRPDQPAKFTPQSGQPVFSTALAVQVAATYGGKTAKELQDLIETVFARPFCQDEGAEGRYGRLLRDLPIPLEVEDKETRNDRVVKVETVIRVPVRLPWPGPGFAKIIEEVRASPSGKNLKTSMNQLGADLTFDNATNAWRAVAAEIASRATSSKAKEIELRMLLVSVGQEAFCGAMADFMLHPPLRVGDVPSAFVAPLLGRLFSLGGELYTRRFQANLERARISRQLEKSVEFSCVPHPTMKAT